ncbi:MAG: hypothetical protein HYR51_06050 [Candidatus Rokubacteria bacterium]|nr:hypothetical protein [Candidatus Rokubacteria bacterium]
MDLSIVLPTLAAIAIVFVLAPVAGAVYSYYRRPKVVGCPEAAREAVVRVNALRAAVDALTGRPALVVTACSLWPRRQNCAQGCTSAAMRDVAARG